MQPLYTIFEDILRQAHCYYQPSSVQKTLFPNQILTQLHNFMTVQTAIPFPFGHTKFTSLNVSMSTGSMQALAREVISKYVTSLDSTLCRQFKQQMKKSWNLIIHASRAISWAPYTEVFIYCLGLYFESWLMIDKTVRKSTTTWMIKAVWACPGLNWLSTIGLLFY